MPHIEIEVTETISYTVRVEIPDVLSAKIAAINGAPGRPLDLSTLSEEEIDLLDGARAAAQDAIDIGRVADVEDVSWDIVRPWVARH